MTFLLVSLVLFVAGGFLAACLSFRSRPAAAAVGAVATALASALGLVGTLPTWLGGGEQLLDLAWNVPFGSFSLRLDALAAWFLVPSFLVTGLAAVYGHGYLGHHGHRRAGSHWLFLPLAAASLVLVLLARDAVLFLVAWEVMSLATWFLVTHEDESTAVREAGWLYLVATHLGTAFLLAYFLLLDHLQPSLNACFVLALVGFGTKAGLAPFHVWLPKAHPAAPSHVSAWMSAVMIKTGLYGIARFLASAPPEAAWGWTLVALGAGSALLGVFLALAQRDLKRVLAYSSVENVGLVALGLGLAVLASARGAGSVALLAAGGALLHVLGHAIFKALLFLGAGAVLQAAGTGDLEQLGGLGRRMPRTSGAFLAGAGSASGLPTLAGFPGEFLLLLAGFTTLTGSDDTLVVAGLVTVASVALVSGLALAAFTRAFGMVFQGEARTEAPKAAHDPGPEMALPMLGLAGLVLVAGLASPLLAWPAGRAVGQLLGTPAPVDLAGTLVLPTTLMVAAVLLGLLLDAGRRFVLAGRSVEQASTWGCGYLAPTPRMQYSASSFSHLLLPRQEVRTPVEGLFAGPASLSTRLPDPLRERVFEPLFRAVAHLAARTRGLQHGQVHLYILYILLTLVSLVIWGMLR